MSIVESRGHGNYNTLKNWVRTPTPGALKTYDYYQKNGLNDKNGAKGRKTRNGDGKSESTHFLLRGGMWDIPADDNDQFLWHYAISLMQNDELTVVEKRTNHFRYHLDFDFEDTYAITLKEFKSYVAIVQEVLRIFYPHSPNVCFECTISMTETKEVAPKVVGAPNLIKTGFHCIFHNIWVDTDKALAIRAYLITKIRSQFGARDTNIVNDWEDIVDESIYIKNGLRMIGSMKYHACKCNARSNNKKKLVPMFPFIKEKASTNNVDLNNSNQQGAPLNDSCDKCQNTGYIFEGRPYFVVAAWDHKCETITRKVKVSKRITSETPCFQRASSEYVRPQWYYPFPSTKMSEEKPGNFYWAMPCPDFGPTVEQRKTFEPNFGGDNDMDLESDDDLFDYRQLGSMKRASDMEKFTSFSSKGNVKGTNEDETDEYVFIPFCDLIVFGNPRSQENEEKYRSNPWQLVRLFHNTLRLVSLRMHPIQESELESLEGKIRADEKHGKAYSPDNYPPSPFPVFMKPALSVPFARYDAVVERMKKDKPLRSRSKRRVEGINEFQSLQRGKTEKVFLTDEALLDEVQLFIRENVGMRMEEPKQPYGQIDVVGIYHNHCPSKKPSAYMVQVRGIGASFCFNKNGDHNSNGIYFKIDKKGIAQRCFCTCADTHGRVTGKPCKEFQGKSYSLPKKLKHVLFPKNKASTSETMFGQEKKVVTDPAAMEMICRSVDKPSFASDLGSPDDLQKGFLEFLKKKRAREESMGLDDPLKRIKN